MVTGELAFANDWLISVECPWRLEEGSEVRASGGRGRLLDEIGRLRALVGTPVTAATPRPPDRIEIEFTNGARLILIDDDPLFEFTESQNVQIVPAVNALQLFVVNDSGTAEGIILFMRNVPGGCAAMTDEFEADFKSDFERFIETIRAAN